MPTASRTKIKKKKGGGFLLKGKKKVGSSLPEVKLPLKASKAVHDLSAYHLLFHGEKKIGKTTLTTTEDDVFLLTFDPLQKSYEIKQRHCPDWKHFMAYLAALEEAAESGDYPYKRVVLDAADIWYRACQDWVEKKLAVPHVSDAEWGKGWDLLKQTFSRAVDRLLALPGGCWFVSHSAWVEIKTRRGEKVSKLQPNLKAAAEEILVGKIDGWFAYDYDGEERVLIIRGDESTGAGCRIRGHFLTPKGRKVREIPMGNSEEEAFENLVKAFKNEQTFTTLEERDEKASKKKGGTGKKTSLLKKKKK